MLFQRQPGIGHGVAVGILVLGVGEVLLGRIPGVDVAHAAGIIRHVARGAEEHARHVHELGEGEVNQQYADQSKVREEQGVDAHGGHRRKVGQAHDEDLDLGDFGLVEIAQADAGTHDADDQPQGEVIVGKRKVAQAFVEQAASQKEQQRYQQQAARPEEAGRAKLHDAVNAFQKANTGRHGFHKETEVTDKNQQEAVVEQQGKNPQPLGGIIDGARPVADGIKFPYFRNRVAEQRTEAEHFQKHALHNTPSCAGTVDFCLLDEVKRLLLPTCGGDAEGHGRFGPVHHAPDDTGDEHDYCHIRQRHAEQARKPYGRSRPGDGSYEQHQQ
ncbi:hypothetical protein SDC9_06897 [bioreactor metagenome]|uniref:Uncharacterized protein n=1 Tax=bioreactor metagenome TaxID=1076179 RepID=A0A644T477_9ZZZZ